MHMKHTYMVVPAKWIQLRNWLMENCNIKIYESKFQMRWKNSSNSKWMLDQQQVLIMIHIKIISTEIKQCNHSLTQLIARSVASTFFPWVKVHLSESEMWKVLRCSKWELVFQKLYTWWTINFLPFLKWRVKSFLCA